jgi:hypothetical protein
MADPSHPDPADTTRALREQALRVTAAELRLTPTAARAHVWGVLMESWHPEAVSTLVAIADGTASLYFSNGGGVVGAGTHDSVRAAAEAFLSVAEAHLKVFAPTAVALPPSAGRVHFYVRTFGGTVGAGANDLELRHGRHALSPVFNAGHALIAAMRHATEWQQP